MLIYGKLCRGTGMWHRQMTTLVILSFKKHVFWNIQLLCLKLKINLVALHQTSPLIMIFDHAIHCYGCFMTIAEAFKNTNHTFNILMQTHIYSCQTKYQRISFAFPNAYGSLVTWSTGSTGFDVCAHLPSTPNFGNRSINSAYRLSPLIGACFQKFQMVRCIF